MPSLLERVSVIRKRVAEAAVRSGRSPDQITLIGAAKRQPVDIVQAVVEAGIEHLGENRVQECEDKQPQLVGEIQWHLIGPLQSNKVNRALDLFDVIQSVDRLKIAERIQRRANEMGVVMPVFLEVNLGNEPSKHGFAPSSVDNLVERIASWNHVSIQGLMAIPPFTGSAEASRPWFQQLRQLRDQLFDCAPLSSNPGYLSMGMSSDFEVAIEEGATHVRVGTALFGERS